MKNQENSGETNKRHSEIVRVTQTMPNTWLSLVIAKQLQYVHYQLGLQLAQIHITRLTSPRHSYTDLSQQDSLL
jgi:hypothetical protein